MDGLGFLTQALGLAGTVAAVEVCLWRQRKKRRTMTDSLQATLIQLKEINKRMNGEVKR